MASNFLKNFNNQLTILISKFLESYLGIAKSDRRHTQEVNYIKKYLNDNSMLYISRQKDVEAKLESLTEKLEINSQVEKSKLLLSYVNRLQTIYENKSPEAKDSLYNYINLIVQLAHSPLNTVVNLDIIKENFEDRYMKNKYDKYIKNLEDRAKEKYAFISQVDIPIVDYNERTPSWSEDEEESGVIQHEDIAKRLQEEMDRKAKEEKMIEEERKKKEMEEKEKKDKKILTQKEINEMKKKNLFKNFKKLFINQNFINNMNFPFFEHLLTLNMRMDSYNQYPSDFNGIMYVDNDFILNLILHLFAIFSNEDINTNTFFKDKFDKLSPIELSIVLLSNILIELNSKRDDLNFLRQIDLIFSSHEMNCSVVISKFISIIKIFVSAHDRVIAKLQRLLYYQKGMIENINIEKTIINSSIDDKPQYSFESDLYVKTNRYIQSLLESKEKLSLLKFVSFYSLTISPIVDFFITISKNIISTKKKLMQLNKYSNFVIVKLFLDSLYYDTNSNNPIVFEVFISLIESYSKFIYEFIINGNLIDVNNEFFIDHLLVKRDRKKIIFCFNEKFSIFNWVDCFKIKSFNLYGGKDVACVPYAFMINNIHFRILETAKTTFLLKNLNVINYFDDLNKECLYSIIMGDEDERKKKALGGVREGEKEKEKEKEKERENNDREFNDLKQLNEKLKIRKGEILKNGKEMKTLKFANEVDDYDKIIQNKINNTGIVGEVGRIGGEGGTMIKLDKDNNDILNFMQNDNNKCNNIFNVNDVEMGDISMNSTYHSNNNNNQISTINNVLNISMMSEYNNVSSELNQICKIFSPLSVSDKNPNQNIPNISNIPNIYNIDIILSNLYLNRLLTINKLINSKFLDILMTKLKIEHHFELMYQLYLFKAGFCMNKFIHELNEFIVSQAKGTNIFPVEHNFFLKNILIELASAEMSDLLPFKEEIINKVSISFNSVNSLIYHSSEDLISIKYEPGLPISIFFDKIILTNYNLVFNFIVKIKRTFILVRDIEIDKMIKILSFDKIKKHNILKYIINYRMFILDFSHHFEFFVFHSVINKLIGKFQKKIPLLNSIDQFLKAHQQFIRDVINFLGLNDSDYIKKVYKILNLIVTFPSMVNRFAISNKENQEETEKFYIQIVNTIEKFKRKRDKIFSILNILKDKIYMR